MTNGGTSSAGFITIDEAASIVGRSHWTIRRWLEPGGKLTRYKSSGRTLVSRSELLERVRPVPVIARQDPLEDTNV